MLTVTSLKKIWCFLVENNAPKELLMAIAEEAEQLSDPRNRPNLGSISEDEQKLIESMKNFLSTKKPVDEE